MTDKKKIRGRKPGQTIPGSRRWVMDRLGIGENCIFVGDPGKSASSLQADIASCYRSGQSMGQQGLQQKSGLAVFEGEIPVPIVKVMRVSPKPNDT